MKGQAAIEYLTTYGWMLLAVSVVSGAVMASNSQACNTGASGFPYGAVELADFGYSEGGMDVLVANQDPQQMDQVLTGVELEDRETGRILRVTDIKTLGYGQREALRLPNVTTTPDCNNFDLRITYERGTAVRSQSIAGVVEANLKINGTHREPYTGPFADFQTDIEEKPSEVVVGEEFEVTAGIQNEGTLETTQEIDVNFTGDTVTEPVTLGFGETESFKAGFTAPSSSGVYPIYVKSENDTTVKMLEVLSSDPMQLTVDIRDYDGSNFEKTADVELIKSGSVLETRSVADGEAVFEVTEGDYTVNLSNPEYFEVSTSVTVNSDTSVTQEMHKIPVIETFDVVDNSECVDTHPAFGYCRDHDVKYDVSWTVSDPSGHGVEANVSYDGSEVLTGFSGDDTIQRDDGWNEEHNITLKAGYNHYHICARYSDTADGTDPSGYSTC